MIMMQFGGITTKWKAFTPEEVRALRENPYTLKVTDKTIAFTRTFKEQFWQGMTNLSYMAGNALLENSANNDCVFFNRFLSTKH